MATIYKLIVFVPETHADIVRKAMGEAGAGKIGKYDFCSFSVKGEGRFRPLKGADPAIGEVDKLEIVPEERIEVLCTKENLAATVSAMKAAHPYEEVAFDIYPLETI